MGAIGEILPERKKSIARLMSETAENLHPSFDGTKDTPEDVVYDLFKVPHKDEASIGRLLSVLKSMGLREDDPRLTGTINKVRFLEFIPDLLMFRSETMKGQ